MGFEHQGEAGFRDFDRAELDPAGRVPFPDRRIPVARGRSAAAGAGLEHVPDEAPAGARVLPVQRDPQTPSPAAHGTLGAGAGEGDDDRLDDFIGAMAGTHRHRRALARPDDRAFLELDRQRPQRAVVLGDVGIEQERKRHRHRRLGVGVGGVDEAGDLRIGLGQVDGDVRPRDGDAGADDDVGFAEAVIVEHRFAGVLPVPPGGDGGADMAFGGVEHVLDRRRQRGAAEFLDHGGQALLAELDGADLGGEVAAEVSGVADVQRQHLQDVLAQDAVLREAHGREAQALVPDFRGGGVVGAMRRAADVGVMRAVDGPEHQGFAIEDGDEDREVWEVGTASVRVIQDIDVARGWVGEAGGQRLGGPGHGADMDWDVVRLRDQTTARIDQRDGEVA